MNMKTLLGWLYSGLFYLLTPLLLLRLLWRSIKAPAYRQRCLERLGFYNNCHSLQNGVWFHAVSVGEAEALFPLVRLLQQRHPETPILVTCTTPTGSARIKAVLQESVTHVYLPYDIPFALQRFFQCFQPKLAVILETELWPNLYQYCGKLQLPLLVINARLSEKSARGYNKISLLTKATLAPVTLIATQTAADAQRFRSIGASEQQLQTLGNIKFDVEIPQTTLDQGIALKQQLFPKRFVCLLASTHKDEESIFLQLYPELKKQIPELLLLIVPRHPERFSDVYKLCQQYNVKVILRTAQTSCRNDTDVYLADTMGELKMLYASADVAFVGGSMVPVGGHNILEAAAVGVPVLFGPYMNNFREIAEGVLKAAAAIKCTGPQDLAEALVTLYKQPEIGMGLVAKSKTFLSQNQGATARIYQVLQPYL